VRGQSEARSASGASTGEPSRHVGAPVSLEATQATPPPGNHTGREIGREARSRPRLERHPAPEREKKKKKDPPKESPEVVVTQISLPFRQAEHQVRFWIACECGPFQSFVDRGERHDRSAEGSSRATWIRAEVPSRGTSIPRAAPRRLDERLVADS